jgi:4-carboxymuconolactone decarboxylase
MRTTLTNIPAWALGAALLALGCVHGKADSMNADLATEGLNPKQQRIVPIAAFTAKGDLPRLRKALGDGLDAGWTINEVKEILIQMYAYAGFPRSLNGLATFSEVLEARQRSGISDELGREPSPRPANQSSVELGTEMLTKLTGAPSTGRHAAFSPAIDTFLKAHLFGDILGRDNLDLQSREIATISALATLEGVNPQLASHFNVGRKTGLTDAQLEHLTHIIDGEVGKERGANARAVLAEVNRNTPAEPLHPSTDARRGKGSTAQATISVRRTREQPKESAPAEHFTGTAHVQRVLQADAPARVTAGVVTFEPGARTAWHAHPLGQMLVVTAGRGWVQQWGEAPQAIAEGDLVWIHPGVKHWHGAAANAAMTHLAVQEQLGAQAVQWMEQVNDEEYQAAERAR